MVWSFRYKISYCHIHSCEVNSRYVQPDLLVLLLASLDPLLQQVFIVAVCSGSQCVDALMGELSAVCIDEHGHKTIQLAIKLVDLIHNLSHCSLENQGQRSNELNCGQFCDIHLVMQSNLSKKKSQITRKGILNVTRGQPRQQI